MTTLMSVYTQLAIEYGKIDESDSGAVNDFFENGVYELSEEVRLEIIEKLFLGIEADCDIDNNEIMKSDVPFPCLSNYKKADKS